MSAEEAEALVRWLLAQHDEDKRLADADPSSTKSQRVLCDWDKKREGLGIAEREIANDARLGTLVDKNTAHWLREYASRYTGRPGYRQEWNLILGRYDG